MRIVRYHSVAACANVASGCGLCFDCRTSLNHVFYVGIYNNTGSVRYGVLHCRVLLQHFGQHFNIPAGRYFDYGHAQIRHEAKAHVLHSLVKR